MRRIFSQVRTTPLSSHSFPTQCRRSFASSPLKAVSTDGAPKAIGPYSQAIKANGFVFISGSLGLNPKTGEFPSQSVNDQAKQSLDNIGAILSAAQSDWTRVVKTTILLADINDFPVVNQIYAGYFKQPFPARATYAVKDLPKSARIEIEAIATCD